MGGDLLTHTLSVTLGSMKGAPNPVNPKTVSIPFSPSQIFKCQLYLELYASCQIIILLKQLPVKQESFNVSLESHLLPKAFQLQTPFRCLYMVFLFALLSKAFS